MSRLFNFRQLFLFYVSKLRIIIVVTVLSLLAGIGTTAWLYSRDTAIYQDRVQNPYYHVRSTVQFTPKDASVIEDNYEYYSTINTNIYDALSNEMVYSAVYSYYDIEKIRQLFYRKTENIKNVTAQKLALGATNIYKEGVNFIAIRTVSLNPDDGEEINNRFFQYLLEQEAIKYPQMEFAIINNSVIKQDNATAPGPFLSYSLTIILLVCMLGFASVCGILLIYYLFNKTLYAGDDISDILQIPQQIIFPAKSDDNYIRAVLQSRIKDKGPCPVIGFTSNHRKNKSILKSLSRLQSVFEKYGQRVIILDLYFDKQKQDTITSCDFKNIKSDMLSLGDYSEDKLVYLSSNEFAASLGLLKKQYDIIFINIRSLNQYPEGYLLSSHLDGFVVIELSGNSNIVLIKATLDKINETDIPLIGCIIE